MAEYGIKRMFFGNTAADIERHPPFTEGPVRADFSTLTGSELIRIETHDPHLALAGFKAFKLAISNDPRRSYLEDRSRGRD